jgi:hypothetical protein
VGLFIFFYFSSRLSIILRNFAKNTETLTIKLYQKDDYKETTNLAVIHAHDSIYQRSRVDFHRR